jgi:ectoine hydroxylase-related dioxygenase (phytanoyl-CoA dioxygenase family)
LAGTKTCIALPQTRKLNLLYGQIFVKESGSGIATLWRNDQPYWPVRSSRVAIVWVPLDAITKESAMEFIKGSHRWNRRFQPFLSATDGGVDTVYERSIEFEPLTDFDAHRAQLHILCLDMQPGDAIVFHALTVHGARANVAQRRRRGYAIRYTSDDVTYFEEPGTNPCLLNSALVAVHAIDPEKFPVVINSEDVSR